MSPGVPSKLKALRKLAKDRGNRHVAIAAKHYAALCRLTCPGRSRRRRPRFDAARMRYVETAAQCLQACSTALDTEILVFGIFIRSSLLKAKVPQADVEKFTGLFGRFGKAPKALQTRKRFTSRGAEELHHLARALGREFKVPWPQHSHAKIAEPRNVMVHRTSFLTTRKGQEVVRLLEDESPRILQRQVERSTACLIACFDALEGIKKAEGNWPKLRVSVVEGRVKQYGKK